MYLRSSKFVAENPGHQKPTPRFGVFFTFMLLSALPCLGMPFGQQSAEAVPLPAIAATLPPTSTLTTTLETHPSPEARGTDAPKTSPVIVIGFLGGRVRKNNVIHREVQLAMHLRQKHPVGVDAEVFQNSHGQRAYRRILHLLDADHDGTLSLAEKQHARIIIYGHSWGASETVTMAHELQDDKIPVLLTILVDRVPKIGEGDPRIPSNVAQAVNFYQLDGLLHGRPTIRAVDPAKTQILGNYQLDYKETHVACEKYPWYARLFMEPHIEIENDPRVWNQVEALISAKLPPEKTTTTAALTSPSE